MDEIYKKIWKLAKPYYEKGRPMDIDHIEWMMQDALLVCEKENVDASLLLPLVILHDVGYSEIPPGNPFNIDMRKEHMKKGGMIAEKILKQIGYDPEKTKEITKLVSIHDNWALGDSESFLSNKILGTFNDLDFMWMATPKGFSALMKIRSIDAKGLYEYVDKNDKLSKHPFSTETTKKLFKKYMEERRKELKGK